MWACGRQPSVRHHMMPSSVARARALSMDDPGESRKAAAAAAAAAGSSELAAFFLVGLAAPVSSAVGTADRLDVVGRSLGLEKVALA
jgi:hypothetical protein